MPAVISKKKWNKKLDPKVVRKKRCQTGGKTRELLVRWRFKPKPISMDTSHVNRLNGQIKGKDSKKGFF